MVSRLPITTRPAQHEIAVSYLARLAALHDLPTDELWRQVNHTRRLDPDLLAVVADQPRARLNRAIVELLDPEPDWRALRHEPQRGCHRCNARHPGGPVLQLLAHHDYVCTRHRIWIGPPDHTDHPQPHLDALPEIVTAQHRHRRLLHRLGPAATYDAVLTGFLICAHRWNTTHTTRDSDATYHWRRRAELLIPPGTETTTFSASRIFAAVYPEAVTLAELLGSLHWRRLAAGGPGDQAVFAAEIGRRLGDPDYIPLVVQDPIAHWMEHDCWRPPSPPNTTYRALKTFAGPTHPKPAHNADTRRHDNATWFTRHRRGGDTLLHHRTLNPIIIRDWSPRMELFAGALTNTATTRTHQPPRPRSGPEQRAYLTAAWTRPEPVASPWLDTATEPLSWHERTEPRPAPAARPYLPHERPRVGRR
ncbi:hypothetical protein [Actinokineospora cianjurensis]|uniref:TniQ protein n=1 Tax=Actinokineospora cianjurensis TaxID=585224 RepID=A0A421B218_9PSEU|nr:hypothetical protein [Actinokineospora cianjurensis]RLK58434.1 hypothetical protein CLV68_4536 [Actinokineospora cianjurensis]